MTKEQELVELLNALSLSEKLRFKLLPHVRINQVANEPISNRRPPKGRPRPYRTTTVGGTIVREWL
jgi:hypothetical protein